MSEAGSVETEEGSRMYAEVEAYLDARRAEFGMIPDERRAQLEKISAYVSGAIGRGETPRLIFVCTHNSRRSHMSQLWAAAAAHRYGIVAETFSGGTESTAFNPRAVAAVERAGLRVETSTTGRNPVYLVSLSDEDPAMVCFSKAYDSSPNPGEGFCAVMVCTDADEACPIVDGAGARVAVPFVDPKVSDGTPEEAATYDDRCAQIAREMLYAMSRVSSS